VPSLQLNRPDEVSKESNGPVELASFVSLPVPLKDNDDNHNNSPSSTMVH